MPAAALRLVLAAAVLSGAAALVYEVVWLRMLGLAVGHAVDALAAVLAAFMAGLAIGAALFGRLAGRLRRPLAACALLEGGLAAYTALLCRQRSPRCPWRRSRFARPLASRTAAPAAPTPPSPPRCSFR